LSKTSIEVQTREVRKTLVIDIRGEVDLFTSPKMRSAIVAAFNSMDISQVAVNLGGVSYIDSSGIATLVEGLQLARSTKRRLVLFGLQKGAREVLELARLDKIFDICATEIEALGQ
jgi:anti-sigma B factor antagonist